MNKIAEYKISRNKATGYVLAVGILIGIANSIFSVVDLTLKPTLFLWAILAIILTIIFHEGVHGIFAFLLGYKPCFGLQPPFVYITFTDKIPIRRFLVIAIAPLVIINLVFSIMFVIGFFKTLLFFILMVNTLGSIGDVWIFTKLISLKKDLFIQDTKTGIEVWE